MVAVLRAATAGKGVKLSATRAAGTSGVAELARGKQPTALLKSAADPIGLCIGMADPPDEIVVDDAGFYSQARVQLAGRPELQARLCLDQGLPPVFERLGIEAEIEALLRPCVGLPSGGRLWIEPVRALTAIDVDSGADSLGGAGALAINLEAVEAIARQCRLRGLSGMIVVDFLDVVNKAERRRVADALRDALADDPESCEVSAMRASGLLEITRGRGTQPLHEVLCEAGDAGWRRDPVSLAYDALRAYRTAALESPARVPVLLATPRILTALDAEARNARLAVEKTLARPIKTCRQDGLTIESYGIQ